jgi:hypothetical protein
MAMLKVFRGPSTEKLGMPKSAPDKSDPAKMGGTGSFGMNISASKVGAPHKKGVKTLGQKALKPKTTGMKGY